MKRFHVHVSVTDLSRSVRFYRSLFDQDPDVLKEDYAKWMLDDPRINFALSTSDRHRGISHVGLQVESRSELGEIQGRLREAAQTTADQPSAECCYAKSTKTWVQDPDSVSWETFVTHGELSDYGDDFAPAVVQHDVEQCCRA